MLSSALCHFWTNFEIGNLGFFRSSEYQGLFEALDTAGGFFTERVRRLISFVPRTSVLRMADARILVGRCPHSLSGPGSLCRIGTGPLVRCTLLHPGHSGAHVRLSVTVLKTLLTSTITLCTVPLARDWDASESSNLPFGSAKLTRTTIPSCSCPAYGPRVEDVGEL